MIRGEEDDGLPADAGLVDGRQQPPRFPSMLAIIA